MFPRRRLNATSYLKVSIFNYLLPVLILLLCLCWEVYGDPNDVFQMNNTVQGFYKSKVSLIPRKASKKRDASQETQRALFLICGVILGVPLGVLAACGVREFVCAMYEKYRLEALRRNYLARMKIPTTVPVR